MGGGGGEVGRAAGVQRRGVKAVRGAERAAGHAVLRGKGNGLQRADPAAVFVPFGLYHRVGRGMVGHGGRPQVKSALLGRLRGEAQVDEGRALGRRGMGESTDDGLY